jgi:hypothetical protein
VPGAGGLGKRGGGCYSASGGPHGGGDLDLAVVGDFAGLDIYTNDGRSHFTDVEPVDRSRAPSEWLMFI